MANNREKNGFLLINKPSGPTSHDVIYQLRKILSIKKIGHAGTLDPFAEGLLLVAVGEATKLLRHYVGLDKEYEAVLKLGATSSTQDVTGVITESWIHNINPTKKEVEKALKSFIGKQKQIPPMYSAKKVNGKKLYELARAGEEIKRKPVNIEVYEIKLLSVKKNQLKIRCRVSSGTYIRTLAYDIGKKLKTGAYLEALERAAIGEFKLKDAVEIADAAHHITPLKTVLVSGTFDGLHPGHLNYFQQARKLGHRLICIVGRDLVVEKIKHKKPKRSEKERIKLVKQSEEIDRVYLGINGTEQEVYDFVASLKPDTVALGYDQKTYTKSLKNELKKRGLSVEIKKMQPFKPERFKSSIVDKSLKKS